MQEIDEERPLSPDEVDEKRRQVVPNSLIKYVNNLLIYAKRDAKSGSIEIQKGQFVERAKKEFVGYNPKWWQLIKPIYENLGWQVEETTEYYIFK